jgi:hypothetical protein
MSQNFISDMSKWMDEFYGELITLSEPIEDEAWVLVSSCIKRVFEDLRRVRATAAIASSDSPISCCTTYLWALIQSHRIMKEYSDSRFRNHPSIAPDIILHVFRTRVTKVRFQNKQKHMEGHTAKLENTGQNNPGKAQSKDSESDRKNKG